MGFFDRFRTKQSLPHETDTQAVLREAIRREVEQHTDETRREFDTALIASTLLLVVAALPDNVSGSPAPLEEDTPITVLTSRNADGRTVLLAFTDLEELQARAGNRPYVGLSAEDTLKLVIDSDYSGIVINPAGTWIEMSRAEIEKLLIGS